MTDQQNKPVILIVDDEVDLREALSFEFERNGFKVVTCSNGTEAFKIVLETPIDLVITDVRMPGGDGVDLLNRIRERNVDIPVVIFVTGFADMTLEEAYNSGANAVMSKPFDRKTLLATVKRSLASKSDRWQVREQPLEASFALELRVDQAGHFLPGNLLNLGQGGMYVSLNEKLPLLGDKVQFTVKIESEIDPFTLEGTGIVRWVRQQDEGTEKRGCGIEFDQLSDSCRSKIIAIIKQTGAKSFIPRS